MRIMLLLFALLVLAGPLDAAQLYRWVDDKGNVEWRDTPPPSGAKKVEQRKVGGSTIQTGELPYSLQQAVKNHPVTLWMTECGEVCNRARAHLNRRGVPHAERNAQAEMEAFKKASGGGMEVPLLLVGSRQVKGYLESEWDAALDAAGYPRTAVAGYKPPARPQAPRETGSPTPVVRLYTNAQCGAECNDARDLLGNRGVKFQEVPADDVSAVEELKKVAAGNARLPVLVVGRFVVPGFDSSSYHKALDESGYKRAAQ
jgi:glutaredoxin